MSIKNKDDIYVELEDYLATKKRPYRHKSTGEIRYMTVYERYTYLDPSHYDLCVNWEEIEDSETLRILYLNE